MFLEAIRHARQFCTVADQRAWLFHVAHNALIDRQRTTHAHETLTYEMADAVPDGPDPRPAVDALAGRLARLSPAGLGVLLALLLAGMSGCGR